MYGPCHSFLYLFFLFVWVSQQVLCGVSCAGAMGQFITCRETWWMDMHSEGGQFDLVARDGF